MATPRSQQISVIDTPYYHCISRCVRRAFLCGNDKVTGRSFEHRRSWLENRLLQLADIFAIDVCAYAIMSNHIHVILHINPHQAQAWTPLEIIERWHRLHKGTSFTQQYARGEQLSEFIEKLALKAAESYSQRLQSISWFMKELKEPIARKANEEDGCSGRFWEGRFKSQALLDEAALATCMAYVDLNPVRAHLSKTPEASEHTSLHRRSQTEQKSLLPHRLYPFVGNLNRDLPDGLPFQFNHYLDLVKLTAKVVRENKRGTLDLSLQPIVRRLGLSSQDWIERINALDGRGLSVIGEDAALNRYRLAHHLMRRLRRHLQHQQIP